MLIIEVILKLKIVLLERIKELLEKVTVILRTQHGIIKNMSCHINTLSPLTKFLEQQLHGGIRRKTLSWPW